MLGTVEHVARWSPRKETFLTRELTMTLQGHVEK